jgi:hypothetical protein
LTQPILLFRIGFFILPMINPPFFSIATCHITSCFLLFDRNLQFLKNKKILQLLTKNRNNFTATIILNILLWYRQINISYQLIKFLSTNQDLIESIKESMEAS